MNYFLILAVILFIYMNLWFVWSIFKKRNDVADIAWGLGFVVVAWSALLVSGNEAPRGLLVNVLVSIWGLRLAWHISQRHRNQPEDYRYQQWREDWGKWFFLRSYFQIYILQGLLLYMIALPVMLIHFQGGAAWGILDLIGLLVWIIGYGFESVGDAQLAAFIKKPSNKGKLIQSGLWAYTRHPNYFGEVTQWWGIWIIALSVPGGWLTIFSPLTITFLILKVSGIPMLEKRMALKEGYDEYRKRVSEFIPLPPKK